MPCILVAHNCKSFDARFLVQAAEKNGVMDDLAKTVSGFTDSLPAFRELLPERKSHSQENLVQDLLVNTLQPLVREKYISASMAIKCASSGLGLHQLQVVYQRSKEERVKQVLMERFDNKPRVSSNKEMLAQICQYFIDNAN